MVSVTSLVLTAQGELEMVHLKTALVPNGTPVTEVVGEIFRTILAVPLIKLQLPVPELGVFAAIVKLPLLHWSWLDPALEVVGAAVLVKATSLVLAVQGELLIVQRNTAVEPAGTPVIPEVGEEGVVIAAVPLTKLQLPVPIVGVFPANVKLPLLHWF